MCQIENFSREDIYNEIKIYRDSSARKIPPIFNHFVSTRSFFLFSFFLFLPQYRHRINLTWFLIRWLEMNKNLFNARCPQHRAE